jgi:hypothetical protein
VRVVPSFPRRRRSAPDPHRLANHRADPIASRSRPGPGAGGHWCTLRAHQ